MITSSLIHFFQHTQIARAIVNETVNEVAFLRFCNMQNVLAMRNETVLSTWM